MLARSMLNVYVPRAERRELYRKKVPGIMNRLRAAELIARKIGLMKNSFYSFSSGSLIREYRRNLAMMKLLSHTLFELEKEDWIKVYPDRVYYVAEQQISVAGATEKHRIFDLIASTVKEVASTFEETFIRRSPQDIMESCRSVFREVGDLREAEVIEGGRERTWRERIDWSPITRRAAKDIAASGYLYDANKKVFERDAIGFVVRSGDAETDRAREMEAHEFDQYTGIHVRMAKERSGPELKSIFSLKSADRSTLFPGVEEFRFLEEAAEVFKLGEGEEQTYLERIKRFGPGEIGNAEAVFLHKFLSLVRLEFRDRLRKVNIESLPDFTQRQLLAQVRESLPEIFDEFLKQPDIKDFLVFLRQKNPEEVDGLEASFRVGVSKIAGGFFVRIIDDLVAQMIEAQPYDINYVISDLHLQDYPHRDTYEILRLIHAVVATGGTLIINGDFMDTWRAGNLSSIMANNKIIFDALRKVKRIIVIKGNHDRWLSAFAGHKVFENVSVVDRFYTQGLHIEHGNFYDKYNSEESKIGKFATRLVTGLERNEIIGPQLLTWVEYVGKRVLPKGYWKKQKVKRVFKGIKDVYKNRDPNGNVYSPENPLDVVFGHYHFPGLFNAYDQINEMIQADPQLSGKVRFFLTDSWYNSEGYAGLVTVFAKKKKGSGQLLTTSYLWEFIDAMKILSLYGTWKF